MDSLGNIGLFTLHHTIVLAPSIEFAINKFRAEFDQTFIQKIDKKFKKLQDVPDASEQVQSFVYKELKNAGIEHPEVIRIKLCNLLDSCNMVVGVFNSKTLLIDSSDYKICDLDNWLNSTPKSEFDNYDKQQRALNFYKFVIHHEAQHILHNDSTREVLFALITSLATDCSIGYLVNKIHVNNKYFTIGLYLSSAYFKRFINRLLYYAYARYCEQQADDSTPNDQEVLKAAMDIFSNIAKEKPESYISVLFKTHPSRDQRAKAFQQRLEKL